MTTLPRFDALLQRSLARWSNGGPQPVELRATVAKLRDRAGRMLELGGRPQLFQRAVRRLLEQGHDSLRPSDDLVLASRLTSSSPVLSGSAVADQQALLRPLLRRWQSRMGQSMISPLLWHSAFLAYFLVHDEAPRHDLRKYLSATINELGAGEQSPSWVAVVQRHRNVLKDEPAGDYAKAWLSGDSVALEELLEHAGVPESSWFWSAFVEGVLVAAAKLDDSEFSVLLPRLLVLVPQFPNFVDRILAGVVNRYAQSRVPEARTDLLELLLSHWGSPQLDPVGKGFRWSPASTAARSMISQWLAEEDLRDFFGIIQSSRRALSLLDQRRLTYWLRFTSRMDFTRLVLGRAYQTSSNPDIRRFVEKRKERISWLQDSNRDNLAILMKMGGHCAMEFAQSGNACYVYTNGSLPFSLNSRYLSATELRNQRLAKERLTHQGPWEEKFDLALGGLGIWPNNVTSRRAKPVVPPSVPVTAPAAAAIEPPLSEELGRELAGIQGRILDHRSKGGRFWVELEGTPSVALCRAMELRGFRYTGQRGFYR